MIHVAAAPGRQLSALPLVAPRKVAAALPEYLLEMQILRPHPRPTESEKMGEKPRDLCFNKPSR